MSLAALTARKVDSLRHRRRRSSSTSRSVGALYRRARAARPHGRRHRPRALRRGEGAPRGTFDDPAFVDLLAENRGPGWLACVGALRRLWPVPSADAADLALLLPPGPDDDDERGRQFWACLRRTVACGRDDPALGDARKRMKQLDADLHAQFMRQGVRRECPGPDRPGAHAPERWGLLLR
jgi:hypothetical protein